MILYRNIVDHFQALPFSIKIVWVLSCVLFSVVTLLTFYLKVLRFYLRKKSTEEASFKKEYEAMLITYLYSGNDDNMISEEQETIISELKVSVNTKFKRKIITSVLYNLVNEVSGEMSEAITTLYEKLGLVHFALLRLKSSQWHVVAKAIEELSHFRIESAYKNVSEFIEHPRIEVRKETKLYLVNLFKFDGLAFLNTFEENLSEWVQLRLLETLEKFDDQQICDIRPWLQSKNHTVVLFAIKLAQIYNQFEVQDTLTDLLSHPNKSVRIASIQALTNLYGIEAKEMLKANFNELSLEEQICFFGMLEKLVVPTDEPFVEKYLFHKNFEIQLLALKILKSINLDKYLGLSKTSTNEKDASMIELVNTI